MSIERAEIRGRERYGDVLDVIEALADGDYGSGSNAIAVLVRRSPLYDETLAKLRGSKAKGRKAVKTA